MFSWESDGAKTSHGFLGLHFHGENFQCVGADRSARLQKWERHWGHVITLSDAVKSGARFWTSRSCNRLGSRRDSKLTRSLILSVDLEQSGQKAPSVPWRSRTASAPTSARWHCANWTLQMLRGCIRCGRICPDLIQSIKLHVARMLHQFLRLSVGHAEPSDAWQMAHFHPLNIIHCMFLGFGHFVLPFRPCLSFQHYLHPVA